MVEQEKKQSSHQTTNVVKYKMWPPKKVNLNEQYKCMIRRVFHWMCIIDQNKFEKISGTVDTVTDQHMVEKILLTVILYGFHLLENTRSWFSWKSKSLIFLEKKGSLFLL